MKEKDTLPKYLKENSWIKELNHKLWITKGARFEANNRLKQKAFLSNVAISFISSYLIIINLVPLFFKNVNISVEIIGFFTTALSILLLVFSQIESSNDFKLNAHHYHSCALEISNLYNDLRIVKELNDESEIEKKVNEITEQYKEVLKRYDNHEPIDTDMFKSQKLDYYELSILFKFLTKLKFYFLVKFKYHFIIFFPPVLFFTIITLKS